MPTVHEALTYARVLHELSIIHTVIKQHERRAVCFSLTHKHLLSPQDSFDCVAVVISVYKQVGYEFFVMMIAILRCGHYNARWYVSLVVQDVRHEHRLTGIALSNKDANLVVGHRLWSELSQLEFAHPNVHAIFSFTFLTLLEIFLNVQRQAYKAT
jgi:hypothetical protein